jgi:hypothetical protein
VIERFYLKGRNLFLAPKPPIISNLVCQISPNLPMRHIWFGIIAQTLVFVNSKPYDISYQKCLKMTEKYPNLQEKI